MQFILHIFSSGWKCQRLEGMTLRQRGAKSIGNIRGMFLLHCITANVFCPEYMQSLKRYRITHVTHTSNVLHHAKSFIGLLFSSLCVLPFLTRPKLIPILYDELLCQDHYSSLHPSSLPVLYCSHLHKSICAISLFTLLRIL